MLSLPCRTVLASASARLTRAVAIASSTITTTTAAAASLSFASPSTSSPSSSSPFQSRPAARYFSTTSPREAKTVKPHLLPSKVIPPYPYGERRLYKQSNRGLYGSARIRFGNNVAPKHNIKTPRYWKPNVHVKRFALPSVGANIKTRLTLRVLKTIRREGGLENYLLKSKPARIKELGPGGWNLRWLLMQSRPVQERFNEERVALGLEPKEIVDRDDIIQYALDFATPGSLSLRSRATLAGLKDAEAAAEAAALSVVDDAFVLGNPEEDIEDDLVFEADEALLESEEEQRSPEATTRQVI